ncbi:unnamed protein product [Nippostrongylus brasiliensis]|uniref:CRISPR type III-B/RAMP module-associated protein Cmr5 n=1 Tax=Nippostrongylus brasiliensis TaxID=27835 RepID=A0A0N4XF43_NIPBR|nr:unnamed protein product [Nippostrongylus brasiliensis]
MKLAYRTNEKVRRNLVGDSFKNDRQRISDANEAVLAVLDKVSKEEVFSALRAALVAEVNALFQLKKCDLEGNEKLMCRYGSGDLGYATDVLVRAMRTVAEQSEEKEIRKLYEEFKTVFNKQNYVEEAYKLGEKVLNITQSDDDGATKDRFD